jgi:hypothetical protein
MADTAAAVAAVAVAAIAVQRSVHKLPTQPSAVWHELLLLLLLLLLPQQHVCAEGCSVCVLQTRSTM